MSTAHDTNPQPGAEHERGELLWVDPRTLIIGDNVRVDVRLDRAFLHSIGTRGVSEVITARRNAEGNLVVRKGQRRTLAAVEKNVAQVPVFVEPAPDPGQDCEAEEKIARIVDQLDENELRADITSTDRVKAHQELLDLGLTAGQLVRRGTPAKKVRALQSVAGSELAQALLAKYDLTLDQAAVIAEFDDDTPAGVEAAKTLTVTARTKPEQFAHVAQRARDEQARAQLISGRAAELTSQGTPVIGATQLDGATRLTQLRGSASEPAGTELTEQAHSGCPGHAAHVHTPPVWGNEDPRVRVDFYCTDATGHGHVSRYGDSPIRANSSQERGWPMSEEQKAERNRVIVNNKAWDSATTVRLRWLKQFLAGKNAPKNADAFIARVIAVGSHDIRRAMESEHRTACELLGLPEPAGLYSGKPQPLVTAIDAASGARLKLLTLAALLGAHEAGTSRDSWRRGTAATRAYFQALASWGYQLSDVEQLVLSPDPDNAAVEASANTAADDAEDRTAHADQRDDSGTEASGRGADVE